MKKNIKVLLYKPNDMMIAEENGTHNLSVKDIVLPYSLAVCAGDFRDHKIEYEILDAAAENLSLGDIKKRIRKIKPNVIAVNTSILAIDLDFDGLGEIKKELGCHIISLVCIDFIEESMERYPIIDVTIFKEWSPALLDVVKAVQENNSFFEIKGIYYRDIENNIIKTEKRNHIHLDDLPFIALEKFPMHKYDHYQILLTAGCSHNCLFCHFGYYPFSGWESKNIDTAMRELKYLKSFGNKYIRNIDNELTLNPKYAKKLCQRIIDDKLGIIWGSNTRASTLDDELAGLMIKAGCISLGFGIESGNQEILNLNKKDLTLEEIEGCHNILKRNKIYPMGFALIGQLGDTRETIRQTFNFLLKLGIKDASFDIVIPYKDTAFFRYLNQKEYIKGFTIDNYIWIYKNVYNYPNLKKIKGIKPEWRIDNLTLDELLEIQKEYYSKVPRGSDRQKFVYLLQTHPKLLWGQFLALINNPKNNFKRLINILIGK